MPLRADGIGMPSYSVIKLFSEHVLKSDNPEDVRTEVKRCLDAAAEGGGYILRSTGQIFHSRPGMIELMCQTARDYGRY